MSDNMYILGIDVGGTTIKSDLYTEKGISQDAFREIPTTINHQEQSNNILNDVLQLISEYREIYSFDYVAISTAGIVDSTEGEIIHAGYTIPVYTGTEFKKSIEERFSVKCCVENDVNCAALGEAWIGVASGSKSSICLTIGTGIGGAILLDGAIWNGFNFSAGEVGYIPIQGQKWQDIASTTALCNHYMEQTGKKEINGKIIFDLYEKEDDEAIRVVDKFVKNFCLGLLPIIYIVNPEQIIIGGGIMSRADILLPKIQQTVTKMIESQFFMPRQIVATGLGNEAGRVGAVYNLLKRECII